MNKVLIITYYWPPGGGAGVQRWLKFAKYLPLHGLEPVILTVDPEYAAYPVPDHSLEKEIPVTLKVYKTPAQNFFRLFPRDKSSIPAAGFAKGSDYSCKGKLLKFVRGNFLIPDPRRGWNRFAFRKALGLIREENISTIITTSPPHSTQLIGLRLKKKLPDIKWIADLRDPWTDIYYYREFYPLWLSRKIDSGYEKRVLRSADGIITVGESLGELFELKVPGTKEKTGIIYNGFDQEDFSGISPGVPEIFTISYIGTLSDAYPVSGLLNVLKVFHENGRNFKLRFIGAVSEKQKEKIRISLPPSHTEVIPYVNHQEAVRYMLESTILLLIIPDHPGNKCIITGKLFEYLASGKPVICLGPTDGDAAEILKKTGHGAAFSYDDKENISRYLNDVSANPQLYIKDLPGTYSKEYLTRQLASLIRKKTCST